MKFDQSPPRRLFEELKYIPFEVSIYLGRSKVFWVAAFTIHGGE